MSCHVWCLDVGLALNVTVDRSKSPRFSQNNMNVTVSYETPFVERVKTSDA